MLVEPVSTRRIVFNRIAKKTRLSSSAKEAEVKGAMEANEFKY
jgi:hypothetical protein